MVALLLAMLTLLVSVSRENVMSVVPESAVDVAVLMLLTRVSEV